MRALAEVVKEVVVKQKPRYRQKSSDHYVCSFITTSSAALIGHTKSLPCLGLATERLIGRSSSRSSQWLLYLLTRKSFTAGLGKVAS